VPSRLRRCLLLLVLPLLAVGCGSSDGGPASTSTLLKDTFSGGKTVKSGKLDVALGVDVLGSAYLGGGSLRPQQLAGRVEELTPGAVPRLDKGMRTARAPWATTNF